MNIQGHFEPGFEPVVREIKRQIRRFGGGGACTVYLEGQKVVDIWSGQARQDGMLWQEDTLALSFSTTKAVAVTMVHILAGEGKIDYEAPVATYWPEFAQNGKARITVRQLLSHQAGLYQMRGLVRKMDDMLNWEHMIDALARAKPVHEPGTRNGYHAFTIGWMCGALVERVSGLRFAEFLQTRLIDPLGLDGLFIGLPDEHFERLADVFGLPPLRPEKPRFGSRPRVPRYVPPGPLRKIVSAGLSTRQVLAAMSDRRMYRVPVPAVNGTFTARSLARMYAALANHGSIDGVIVCPPHVVEQARQVQTRRLDNVVLYPLHWRLGYHRADTITKNYPGAFGHYGFGGSGGWANPDRRLAAAMVHNGNPVSVPSQIRMVQLNGAIYKSAAKVR